jgi:hypothetical protein
MFRVESETHFIIILSTNVSSKNQAFSKSKVLRSYNRPFFIEFILDGTHPQERE